MTSKQHDTVSKARQAVYIGITVLMALLIIGSCTGIFRMDGPRTENAYLRQTIAVLGMLFAAILFISCCVKLREDIRKGRIFAAVSALLYAVIFLSGVMDVTEGTAGAGRFLLAVQTAVSVISALIHLLFWFYQCASLPKSRTQRIFSCVVDTLILMYLAAVIVNLFTGFLFYTDDAGRISMPGVLWDMAVRLMFYLVYLLYTLPQKCTLKKKLALVSFAVFPLCSIIVFVIRDTAGAQTFLFSVPYIFLLLAAYVVFICDYGESQERYLRQKAELAELKTELMLLQINPHFIANTLNSVVALCRFDAREAERAARLLAGYLRENYVDMAGEQMIPFERELQNLKNYIAIEQIRFPDLRAEYEISCTQFLIPAMTVQPLLENAVNHGIKNKKDGLLRISACETQDAYLVRVEDNGAGFSELPRDTKGHVGIANTDARLRMLCSGSLTIRNRTGGGTECEILIPKEEKAE